MAKRKASRRKKQKGGLAKRIINATGGVKGKDGKKRKYNLKWNPYNRNRQSYWQKGGTAMPVKRWAGYTNTHGWRGWGNHWFPSQMGAG